jgi:hypothetical protein
MSNWYIGRNKQKFGPFSTVQLQQLIALGLVKETEHVLQEGASKWVTAALVREAPPAGAPQSYWLLLNGKHYGPYPAERVRVGLMRRQIAGDTLACPEGGKAWAPLAQIAEFQGSLPPAPRSSSHAQLAPSGAPPDMSPEEASLHLAGKQGDTIARLISTLSDLKRRYADNPSMVEMIDKNIHDLKAIRANGFSGVFPGPTR